MDSIISLESKIRKGLINKDVFFDVEKANNMLWKEGLVIKLDKMDIKGRLYRKEGWIMDFLFNRTIEVKVGSCYSHIYTIDNGTSRQCL